MNVSECQPPVGRSIRSSTLCVRLLLAWLAVALLPNQFRATAQAVPPSSSDPIPAAWLPDFASDPRSQPLADPDNDRANNFREYLDKTNPLDSKSVITVPIEVNTVAGSTPVFIAMPALIVSKSSSAAATSTAAPEQAQRLVPALVIPTEPFQVQIVIRPPNDSTVHAVEERLPDGWTVSAVSHSGEFDPVRHVIRWGPFFDRSVRTLTYETSTDLQEHDGPSFVGILSVDGSNLLIGGPDRLNTGSRLQSVRLLANGEIDLQVQAVTGESYRIEVSTDLQQWTPLGSSVAQDGRIRISDPAAPSATQRFYRLVRE